MSEISEVREEKPGVVKSLFGGLSRALRVFLAPYAVCFLLVLKVLLDSHNAIPAESPFYGGALYPALLVLFGLYLMLAALFAGKPIHAVWRVLAYIGCAAVSIGVFLVSVWLEGAESPLLSRFYASALLLALCAVLTVLPLLCREREKFPRYTVRVLLHGVLCGMLTSVVMSGILLLFGALNALFDWDILNYFFDVPVILYGLGFPLLFMTALFPREEEAPYHKVLWGFCVYALLPILVLLTLILCVYLLRILVNWTWPVNAVTPLVLTGAVLLLFGLLFLSGRKESRIYPLYARPFALIWFVPLGMFFAGVGIRIFHYGLTPLRVYLLMLGVFVAVTLLPAVAAPKKYSPRLSMLILAGMVFVTTFCPFGNAFALSARDQTARLDRALADAGMGDHLAVTPNPDVTEQQRRAICDAADYLMDYTVVPVGSLREEDTAWRDVFGFDRGYWEEETDREYLSAWGDTEYTLLDTSETCLSIHAVLFDWSDDRWETGEWTVTADAFTVTVSDGKTAAEFDLAALAAEALLAEERGQEDWYAVPAAADGVSARAVFGSVDGYRENGRITVTMLDCMLLLEE